VVMLRKLERAAWLLRYWVLWKYRRQCVVLALMLVPLLLGASAALYLVRPAGVVQEANPFVWLLVLIIAALVAYAMTPKQPPPEPQQAEAPKVEDGAGIVHVYGDVWIDDPVMIAWQQVGMDPIRRRAGKK
jgi:hypothetical protein